MAPSQVPVGVTGWKLVSQNLLQFQLTDHFSLHLSKMGDFTQNACISIVSESMTRMNSRVNGTLVLIEMRT